jgi:cytidylate kinase
VADVAADLARRDRIDSNRAVAPLQPAQDAVVLDTASLDVGEVVDSVLALVDATDRRSRCQS